MGTLLLLTGRGAGALGALVLFGPLAWSWWHEGKMPPRAADAARGAARCATAGACAGSRADDARGGVGGAGLAAGGAEVEIRAAYLRLMQGAHPDKGGSAWLAARINQARDLLLRR